MQGRLPDHRTVRKDPTWQHHQNVSLPLRQAPEQRRSSTFISRQSVGVSLLLSFGPTPVPRITRGSTSTVRQRWFTPRSPILVGRECGSNVPHRSEVWYSSFMITQAPQRFQCRVCRKAKPSSDFYRSKTRRPYGLSSECKSCTRERLDKIPKKPVDDAQRERWRNGNLQKKFGITALEYDAKNAEQNGLCAICGRPETDIHHKTGEPQRLAVDHDKKTGRVRGLLCAKCNKGIGSLMHNISILKSAIAYLEKYECDDSS